MFCVRDELSQVDSAEAWERLPRLQTDSLSPRLLELGEPCPPRLSELEQESPPRLMFCVPANLSQVAWVVPIRALPG